MACPQKQINKKEKTLEKLNIQYKGGADGFG